MCKWGKRASWQPSEAQRALLAKAAEAFGFDAHMALSRNRQPLVTRMRFGVVWVLQQVFPELTSPDLAHLLGGRDHSTILHSLQRAADFRDHDEEFRQITDALVAGEPAPICRKRAAERELKIKRQREERAQRYRPSAEELAELNLRFSIELAGEPPRKHRREPFHPHSKREKSGLSGSEIITRRAHADSLREAREAMWLAREKPGLNGRKAKPLSRQVV